jgi:glycosyltransferase involved in cell wall biosynthesis
LEQLDLPETFIIYHGPGDRRSLEHLVQAWNWASAAIGGSYPLLVFGLDHGARAILSGFVEEYDLEGSLRLVLDVSPELLPYLYQRCSAVFHPAPPSPWSGPVRLALACGKPLVASENSITDAIAGPAAYLAPAGDARALGAALVTVIVEEQVAESLSAAAFQRTKNRDSAKFGLQLLEIYRSVLAESD